ncbi:DUF2516 family protein [Lolliginicoccus levis]|uniref:DUF2516 family protein n=1 Tax=Lolliginicoccus levis TaxID=2919542 RepID=UPI00241C8A51|nr:DUF2516 family protein [Lolliginicoccus levis]
MEGFLVMILTALAIGGGVFALVHAARQRPDAYTATDKLTKPTWLAILAVSVLVIFVFSAYSLLGLIGVIAIGVYLADVRPKVDEIQGGPRW